MPGPALRNRFGWFLQLASVLFLLPAMPLLSQERVSSVKEPFSCPVGGLVSCGTEFLRFSFRTGFHIVYARRPETYNLNIYGLRHFPGPPQPDSMMPARRPAITADATPIYGIDQDCEFKIDPGCSTLHSSPGDAAAFAPTVTSSAFRYATFSESIADRVDQAIKRWADACHADRATAGCAVGLSGVVSTLRQARRELAVEPYTYGAPKMTRVALRHENEELALAYGEMVQGFQCWAGECNGDPGTSMGPRAAIAFEAGITRRIRVDDALGRLLIAGN
jgi:hypothetical protein